MSRYIAVVAATLLLSLTSTVSMSASHQEAPRVTALCCRNTV